MINFISCILLFTSYFLTFPMMVQAYIGPGAGFSAIGSILAFVGTILLLVIGFLWYPLKRLLHRRKSTSNQNMNTEETEQAQLDGDTNQLNSPS